MSITPLAGLLAIAMIIGTSTAGAAGAAVVVVEQYSAFPELAATIELRENAGDLFEPLDERTVLVLEDGNPVAAERVRVEQTAMLESGPALGVVLDASELLGVQEVEAARAATAAILAATSGQTQRASPISLWLPSGDAATPSRVAEFAAFTEDRNAVINYLNTRLALQPRATPLYASARDAVEATAQAARSRASSGVVVLLSDGLDPLSADQYETTLRLAREQGVRLLALRYGRPNGPATGGERLRRLATETGGTFLDHPAPVDAAAAYARLAQPAGGARYRVSYVSELPADERAHSWQIVLTQQEHELAARRLVFDARLATQPLRPAADIATLYLLYALPGAVLLCALLALVLALWRRITRPDTGKLRSLAHAGTHKRSAHSAGIGQSTRR